MKIRKVCIIGGSGFVGKHIAHWLTEEGISVRIATRHYEHARQMLVLPTASVMVANVHNDADLDRLLNGIDAVINLVGILNGDFAASHVDLPRKIVAACHRNGITRLVHMSALHADTNGPSDYLRSKGEGEKIVQSSGLQTTVFRPSVIFGPGDSFLNLFAGLVKQMPLIPLASPNANFQPVFVENVAQAFVASLSDHTTFGQRYDLCGPKVYSLRELVEYVALITGRDLTVIGLSDRLSYLQALLMEWLPGKLMTRDNYYSMKVDSTCDCVGSGNLSNVFGIRPTPLEEVAPFYLALQRPRDRYTHFRDHARR